MLLITRRPQERVWIGDICITLVEIDRNKCRLGIDADKSVLVMREELLSAAEIAERRARATEGNRDA